MEYFISLVWISTFTFSIFILNFLSFMIKSYIVNQPSGNKSLFVYMILDICTVIQIHGTLHCSLGILSRCDAITDFLRDNENVSVILCIFVELVNTATIFHLGNSCIVRILCLKYISFMEETVGERATRGLLALISLSAGIGNSSALVVSGGDYFTNQILSIKDRLFHVR
jgi:hypothetical protein